MSRRTTAVLVALLFLTSTALCCWGIAVTGAPYEPVVYAFTGAGGLVLSVLLLRSGLVPRWLAVLGVVGYAALLTGVAFAASGLSDLDSGAGFVFYVPGGVFELLLPILLLVKGFTRERAHA